MQSTLCFKACSWKVGLWDLGPVVQDSFGVGSSWVNDVDYFLLWHKIYCILPNLLDIIRNVWSSNKSFSINRELVVKSLSSSTTVHGFQHLVNLGLSPGLAISVHVVESKAALDLLSSGDSVLNVGDGLCKICLLADSPRVDILSKSI